MGKLAVYTIVAVSMFGCSPGADEGSENEPSAEAAEAVWNDATARGQASSDPAILSGLGELLFRSPIPKGNGRACGTCHVPEKNFTISPAEIEQRFQKNPNDPLFRSIDADDFANDFTTVRTKGLFRVTLDLPPNVKLADDPAARTVQVWRAVPTVQNVKLTAPYTHDGRALDLASQARGAANEHSRPQQDLPGFAFDLIARFQAQQFSSPIVKKISDRIDAGQAPPAQGQDYDKPLTPLEQEGFDQFTLNCAVCHGGNARENFDPAFFPSPFTTVGISEFNAAQLPVRLYEVTNPDGSVTTVPSPDPGRMLVTGNVLDANAFDSTQLRGVAKTAPYFHDNSKATLTDVLNHYNLIFQLGGLPTVPAEKFPALIAYLNRLLGFVRPAAPRGAAAPNRGGLGFDAFDALRRPPGEPRLPSPAGRLAPSGGPGRARLLELFNQTSRRLAPLRRADAPSCAERRRRRLTSPPNLSLSTWG